MDGQPTVPDIIVEILLGKGKPSWNPLVVEYGKVVVFWKPIVSAKRKRGSPFRPRSRFALTVQIAKLYHLPGKLRVRASRTIAINRFTLL